MRLFRKPCVSEKEVLDAIHEGKQLETEKDYMKKMLQSAKEYEYVRHEHGYDYMPPSAYVPSHSMDGESIECSIDALGAHVHVEVPGSDISGSMEEEDDDDDDDDIYVRNFDPFQGKKPIVAPAPVPVPPRRAKPVPPEAPQPYHRREEPTERTYQHDHHDHHSTDHEPVAVAEKPSYHRARQPKEKPQRRDPIEKPSYRQKAPEKKPSHRRKPVEKPNRAPPVEKQYRSREATEHNPYRGEEPPMDKANRGRETRETQYRQPKVYQEEEDDDDDEDIDFGSIKKVPTAYSYLSDDSAETFLEEKSKGSRYTTEVEEDVDTDDDEHGYRRLNPGNHPQNGPPPHFTGWGESEGSFNTYWRKKRSSGLEEFTTPAYRRRNKHGESSPESHERDEHRESRFDREERRGRSPSRERAPYRHDQREGMERRRSTSKERYYDDEEQYAPRRPSKKGSTNNSKLKRSEKQKSRGLFSRIRDSVRGQDKKTERNAFSERRTNIHANRSRDEGHREKGALFENPPPSTRSDVSPNSYPHDSERVPYPYDDHEPRRSTSASPPEYERPRPTSGRNSPHDGRPSRNEYWAEQDDQPPADMRRSRSNTSSMPFESARNPAPVIRVNPDRRHRQIIPTANSMSKHQHRSQQPMVRAGTRPNKNTIPPKQGRHTQGGIPRKQGRY
jgi:hypothetical protein